LAGDVAEALADDLDVGGTALRAGEVVEAAGDLATAVLARPALTARLDVEEARHHAGDREHAAGLVVDDEAGGAEPAAGRGEAGGSRAGRVSTGLDWPASAALARRPSRMPPPRRSITSRSGVPGSASP